MSNDKNYYVDYEEWNKMIEDITLDRWNQFGDNFLEIDRLFAESAKITQKIPGLAPFQHTSQKRKINKIFKNIRILYTYVKDLIDEIIKQIDQPFHSLISAALQELSAIKAENFKTKNILGLTQQRQSLFDDEITGTEDYSKEHLTFADFTGQSIGDISLITPNGFYTDHISIKQTVQNQAVNSFVELFQQDYLETRNEYIGLSLESLASVLEYLEENPGMALTGIETNPDTGAIEPIFEIDAEKHSSQILALRDIIDTINNQSEEFDQTVYREYMKHCLALGEFDYQADRPVRQVLSSIADATLIIPVIESAIGYDFILGKHLTEEDIDVL